MPSDKASESIADRFSQHVFVDRATGISLPYNLFIPENYSAQNKYPLVLFIHDAGAVGCDPQRTLTQGIGATVWAEPYEQAKHACFVLAPQFSKIIVNDESEATTDLDVLIRLVDAIVEKFSIDTNRLYTTGQSMGCMSSIEIMIRRPDLFTAALLVAGQWDAEKMSALPKAKMWVLVAEGDLKAFPGMNASMHALESKGAIISRAFWNGLATAHEFDLEIRKIIANHTDINYTVLKKGTVVPSNEPDNGGTNHVNTWRIAYTIEGLRDWLFAQTKQ